MREIPYNYTSADDQQIVTHWLGDDVWQRLENLRSKRITGRSARLLMRIIGDVFVLQRNPFLRQNLIEDGGRRDAFFAGLRQELETVRGGAAGNREVLGVIDVTSERVAQLDRDLAEEPARRQRLRKHVGAVIGEENIQFDPFALVSHATDATDWRLHLPVAVARPEREDQVAPLLKAIRELGLHAIPRGAGTGLTGGAVPVRAGCVMINTEKLDRIHGIARRAVSGPGEAAREIEVLRLEAGVITEAAMEYARHRDRVFATDPTSAWA